MVKPHIVILNRSFWPDGESTGQFLIELCEELVKTYSVTAIVGNIEFARTKNYFGGTICSKETYKEIEIIRVWHTRFWKGWLFGRIANWLTYSCAACFAALRIKPEMIVVCTDPPFLGIMVAIISRLRSIPYIYFCMDLFPDVAYGIGKLKKTNIVGRVFDYFNKWALCLARRVVCIGSNMKERLKNKRIPEDTIQMLPLWVDTSEIQPVPKKNNPLVKRFGLSDKFIIMYSGNLGLSQEFDAILRAVCLMHNRSNFCLVFVGDGAGKKKLQDYVKSLSLGNVVFIPRQAREMLSFSLSMADLHLIPLKKGLEGAVVPSKVYGIMAVERPYVAIADKNSEPAILAEEFGCGLWVDPENEQGIAQVFNWAMTHREELEKMGRAGKYFAETRVNKKAIMNEWLRLLHEVL